jgi:hypothetical protein
MEELRPKTAILLIPISAAIAADHCSHGCDLHQSRSMIESMQEILANTDDASKPLSEQQFYELTLLDPEPDVSLFYRVRQAHVRWDEQVAGMVWDNVD